MSQNVLFVLSGNCRTFLDCIDSCYTNVILSMFEDSSVNSFVYLYLKRTDPGPKGQEGWNFTYKDVDRDRIVCKINDLQRAYPHIHIDYVLLDSNEINDSDLLCQVKERSLYVSYYAKDSVLLRGMHCHYNLEQCGKYILEKEKTLGQTFQYIVYVRPDLYFTSKCNPVSTYDTSVAIFGAGPTPDNNDHIAIVPRLYLTNFFFDRMTVYRTNTTHKYGMPEEVYWATVPYVVKDIGNYYIKRE